MRPLSPTDCVSPAISRTKLVLFSPFRFGRTWKLSATGYLAFSSTVFVPFPLFYLFLLQHAHTAAGRTLIALGIGVATLVWLVLFYVFTRLQMAFFDIVLNREAFVAPAWRRTAAQTWPWLWLKVGVGCVLSVLFAVPMVGLVKHSLSHAFQTGPRQPLPPDFFAHFILFEFLSFATFGTLFLLGSLFQDFILPSIVLEGASVSESFRRFTQLVRNEPGQCVGFVALKAVLALVGYIGQTVVVYAAMFLFVIVAIILGILGFVILHAIGASHTVMLVVALVVGLPLILFFTFYTTFIAIGTLVTFLQSYALYFLGGRYPLLGDLLDRSMPPPPVPFYGYAPPPQQQWPAPLVYPPAPVEPQPVQWHTAVYPPTPEPPPTIAEPTQPEPPLTNPPNIDTTE